jgi:hypothetical protein
MPHLVLIDGTNFTGLKFDDFLYAFMMSTMKRYRFFYEGVAQFGSTTTLTSVNEL